MLKSLSEERQFAFYRYFETWEKENQPRDLTGSPWYYAFFTFLLFWCATSFIGAAFLGRSMEDDLELRQISLLVGFGPSVIAFIWKQQSVRRYEILRKREMGRLLSLWIKVHDH